jgi:hypothetical protein
VTRRECGTCRFFEQSGIGEAGWCRNQRCREIVGLALVRRQELACRIGWDKDYYESSSGGDMIPGQERPAPNPGRQRTGYQGVRPDDIIVGIEQPRAGAEPAAPAVPRSRVSNVGEAHRRALERRQVAQQSGDASPARRLESALPAPERPLPPSNNGNGAQDGRERPLTSDESVSPPRLASPPPAPMADTGQASHLTATTDLSVMAEPIVAAPPVPPPDRRRNAPPGMQTSPAPFEPRNVVGRQGPPDSVRPPFSNQPQSAPLPAGPPDSAPATPLEVEWYQGERQRHRGKRCANCRDFQVAESGDRGWCRNRFAFPTPQLVGPNDLACLSCIGTWWAANDQWWLAKAPAPQQMPTPYADALLEEMQEEERRHATVRRPGAG